MPKNIQPVIPATIMALCLFITTPVMAGSLSPTNMPGQTMRTLEEIYQKVQNMVSQTPQSLSAATSAVSGGYYAATNLAQVDADLIAANIRTNVTLFGIAGTMATNGASVSAYPAMVAQTGQTNTLYPYDDGVYRKGVAWPTPRFTVQPSGNCVLDNMTGLVWARNGNPNGLTTFSTSLTYCENLTLGGTNDWRMPNIREMMSLIHLASTDPFFRLPVGHPFTNVSSTAYWTSTKAANYPVNSYTWTVALQAGPFDLFSQAQMDASATLTVWPVRGP